MKDKDRADRAGWLWHARVFSAAGLRSCDSVLQPLHQWVTVMARHIYEEGRRIAALLAEQGQEDGAAQLRHVIDTSTSGTEIAMGLRFHLKRFLDQGHAGDHQTSEQVRSFVERLEAELAP